MTIQITPLSRQAFVLFVLQQHLQKELEILLKLEFGNLGKQKSKITVPSKKPHP